MCSNGNMFKCALILTLIIILSTCVSSARILCIFTVPYHSHQVVLGVLAASLARRGHQVVHYSPEPLKQKITNLTDIDVSGDSFKKCKENYKKHSVNLKYHRLSASEFLTIAYKTIYAAAEDQIKTKEAQKLIKENSKFDLIIAEDCARASLWLGARFEAPIVLASSFGAQDESFNNVGSEIHPIFLPYLQTLPKTFTEKIKTLYYVWQTNKVLELEETDNKIIKNTFGAKALSIRQIRSNVRMVLSSWQNIFDNNRAVTLGVTQMGSIHIKDPEPLPQSLLTYLDSSNNGVIYMSLGSMHQLSDLPVSTLRVILNVVENLPFDVLWIWNGGEITNKPQNLRLEKWLPQTDLLRHSSIKLFVTQGGLQSVFEGIASEVPLLGFPIIAEQNRNLQFVEDRGACIILDLDNLTEDDFNKTIFEMTENDQYRTNMSRLSALLQDQQFDGLDLALRRIEKLIDFGLDLRGPAANVTFSEYFMLDIFIPLTLFVIGILIVTYLALKVLVKAFVSQNL